MRKLRALLEAGLLMGIAYLIYEIMFFVYNYIVYRGINEGWVFIDIEPYLHLSNYEAVALGYVKDHPLEYMLLCWVFIAVMFLLLAIIAREQAQKTFNLYSLRLVNGFASVFVGLGLVFAINGIVRFISETTKLEFDFMNLDNLDAYNIVYLFVIVGIVIPVFEEFFFRGVLLSRLRNGYGVFLTVVLSSVLFSVSHFNIVQSIYVLPVGLLAGYLVCETGSVFSAIWLHIAYNVVNIYLAKIDFFKYNSVQILVMILMGFVLMIFGMSQIRRDSQQKAH